MNDENENDNEIRAKNSEIIQKIGDRSMPKKLYMR